MHFDFTVHFWSLLLQLTTLSGVSVFLIKVYNGISTVVRAVLLILEQHKEMHRWYLGAKDKWPQN